MAASQSNQFLLSSRFTREYLAKDKYHITLAMCAHVPTTHAPDFSQQYHEVTAHSSNLIQHRWICFMYGSLKQGDLVGLPKFISFLTHVFLGVMFGQLNLVDSRSKFPDFLFCISGKVGDINVLVIDLSSDILFLL